MTDRSILFNGPMVLATLAGRKTQTRRVVSDRHLQQINTSKLPSRVSWTKPAPYGKPGDRLVVRETWQYADWTEDGMPWIRYRADGDTRLIEDTPEGWSERLTDAWASLSDPANFAIDNRAADRRWRPAIHMSHWASRVTPEITGVRVERLQDISEADAIAEGIERVGGDASCSLWKDYSASQRFAHFSAPSASYRTLWESINGPGSWDANPLVWVVEFCRDRTAHSATRAEGE